MPHNDPIGPCGDSASNSTCDWRKGTKARRSVRAHAFVARGLAPRAPQRRPQAAGDKPPRYKKRARGAGRSLSACGMPVRRIHLDGTCHTMIQSCHAATRPSTRRAIGGRVQKPVPACATADGRVVRGEHVLCRVSERPAGADARADLKRKTEAALVLDG